MKIAIFVFDVSDITSFNQVSYWVDKVFTNINPEIKTVLLIGSKIDLRNKKNENIIVSTLQGQELSKKLAKQYGILFPYVEVSAKTGEGIQEIFHEMSLDFIKNSSYNL